MATNKLKRTFNLSIEVVNKLTNLRNYHNKTYDKLVEIVIENAFLKMSEDVNLEQSNKLEEQNLRVGFQIQQLTLMFSELKKELVEVKAENKNLYQSLNDQSKLISDMETKNKDRSVRYTANIKYITEWISNKDKSFLDKIKERI